MCEGGFVFCGVFCCFVSFPMRVCSFVLFLVAFPMLPGNMESRKAAKKTIKPPEKKKLKSTKHHKKKQ